MLRQSSGVSSLALALNSANLPKVPPEYRWITRDGTPLRPSVMTTTHCFNAFRMLFNHFSGHTDGTRYKVYHFNPEIFTDEYMDMSLRALGTQLALRDDLTLIQRGKLERMARAIKPRPQEITSHA